jgi:hypothetical protein
MSWMSRTTLLLWPNGDGKAVRFCPALLVVLNAVDFPSFPLSYSLTALPILATQGHNKHDALSLRVLTEYFSGGWGVGNFIEDDTGGSGYADIGEEVDWSIADDGGDERAGDGSPGGTTLPQKRKGKDGKGIPRVPWCIFILGG